MSRSPPCPSQATSAPRRLRPGDIVGALTTEVGIAATEIGQISVMDRISFVAVTSAIGPQVLAGLNAGRIKKKRFRAYQVTPPRGR
jgi:ATP-independent RNA helicase DbpA